MKWHFLYLIYFIKHKWFVFLACMKLGVPIKQALLHDLSKLTQSEWPIYVRYSYQRKAEFLAGKITHIEPEFDSAWNHHQKVNKHHWQYHLSINPLCCNCYSEYLDQEVLITKTQILVRDYHSASCLNCGKEINSKFIKPIEIPEKYAREMISDWLGAGRAKNGSWNIEKWIVTNGHEMIFHWKTVKLVSKILREELNMPLAAESIEKCNYEL